MAVTRTTRKVASNHERTVKCLNHECISRQRNEAANVLRRTGGGGISIATLREACIRKPSALGHASVDFRTFTSARGWSSCNNQQRVVCAVDSTSYQSFLDDLKTTSVDE